MAAVFSNTIIGGERESGEGVYVVAVPWLSYRRGRREPILLVLFQFMWYRLYERVELLRRGLGFCPCIRQNESEVHRTIKCSSAFGGVAYRRVY